MKKTLTFLSVALIALWACAVTNAGPAKKFTKFENARITGLEIGSGFEVIVVQGPVAKAEFEVSADWVDRLKVELDEDGTLDVSINGVNKPSRNPILKLKLTCPALEQIDASGAASIQVQGAFSTANLKVDASGASVVKFNQPITVSGEVEIDVSGASVVHMIGTAQWVDLEASGASQLDLVKLTTPRVQCEVSGASSVDIYASQEATGKVSGASSVTVKGGGAINFNSVTGASSVSAK